MPDLVFPNELLAHVFLQGACEDAMFAVLVSPVSRHSRAVALTSPTVWTNIVVVGSRGSIELLELFMTRSATFLVDVHLQFRELPLPWGLEAPLSQVLRLHIQRCKELTVEDPDDSYLRYFLPTLCSGIAQSLHTLVLCTDYADVDDEDSPTDLLSAQFPALRAFEVTGCAGDALLNIRINTLTELCLLAGDIIGGFESLPSVLCTVPFLKALRVSKEILVTSLGTSPVNLPELRTFGCHACRPDTRSGVTWNTLLCLLEAPKLEALEVDFADFTSMFDSLVDVGKARFPRLSTVVTSSEFFVDAMDRAELEYMVSTLSPVTTLREVSESAIEFTVLEGATQMQRDALIPSWPSLRSIRVECRESEDALSCTRDMYYFRGLGRGEDEPPFGPHEMMTDLSFLLSERL